MAAVVMGVLVSMAVFVVVVTVAMSVQVGLDTAADAAALAAVAAAVEGGSPAAAAAEMATRNGAKLTSCRCPDFEGESFSATVIVGRAVVLPLVGVRWISIERSAGYEVGSTVG